MFRILFLVFSLILIEKIHVYETLKTWFDHISKHLEFCQKFSAVPHTFKDLLVVWKCGETWYLVCEIKCSLNFCFEL